MKAAGRLHFIAKGGLAAASRPLAMHPGAAAPSAVDKAPASLCVLYGPGPERAPWHTRIHQVPSGKHALRSPAVHAASARAYCVLNARRRFTASVVRRRSDRGWPESRIVTQPRRRFDR
jgi:hypothetical protein